MNTVEVVIKLPEKTYSKILSNKYDYGDMNVIIQAGTPLPRKHGRLIDEKSVYKKFYCRNLAKVAEEVLNDCLTIIEAREVQTDE